MTVISIGVINVKSEAWIGKVKDKPFINSIWLSKIAVSAQSKNAGISRLLIFSLEGFINTIDQNKKMLTPIRIMFNPNGAA